MKRFLAFLLSLILALSMCGCGITEVQAPTSEPSVTTVPSETTEDLTAGAEAVLAEIAQYHSVSDDFDDVMPFLSKMECKNLKTEIVDGADHCFTGMHDEYIAFADYLT